MDDDIDAETELLLTEPDPEFERLLAEEEEVARNTRRPDDDDGSAGVPARI